MTLHKIKIGFIFLIAFAATPNLWAKVDKCVAVLDSPSVKPELVILTQALKDHFSVKEFTLESTQAAITAYIDIIDPFKTFLTKDEIKVLTHMSPKRLKQTHDEVFSSPDRKIFAALLDRVINRINRLAEKFSTDLTFRQSAFVRFAELKQRIKREKSDSKNDNERPNTAAEMKAKFIDIIAFKMLSLQKHSLEEKSSPITDREAFIIAVREVRGRLHSMSGDISKSNLPILIAKSYISTLDPHSDLLLPSESRQMTQSMSPDMVGIGIHFVPDMRGLLLTEVLTGGSAQPAGLKKGDIITHMTSDLIQLVQKKRYETGGFQKDKRSDWIMVRNLSGDIIRTLISGAEGSQIKIRVERNNKTMEFDVIRKKISLAPSRIKIDVVDSPSGKLAHIEFNSFYHESGANLRAALKEILEKNKIAGVALDIRQNGGGSVYEIPIVLSSFMSEGVVFAAADGQGKVDTLSIDGTQPVLWDGPLIVMTDPFSASASESISGTLQDYGRAVVVGGESTFGKGSMQNIEQEEGGQMRKILTTALFYTPSGRTSQKTGILSDVVISQPDYLLVFERDLKGVIPGVSIQSLMPEQHNQAIVDKENIIKKLIVESQLRQSQRAFDQSTSVVDWYTGNTKESLDVLADLVRLLKK